MLAPGIFIVQTQYLVLFNIVPKLQNFFIGQCGPEEGTLVDNELELQVNK